MFAAAVFYTTLMMNISPAHEAAIYAMIDTELSLCTAKPDSAECRLAQLSAIESVRRLPAEKMDNLITHLTLERATRGGPNICMPIVTPLAEALQIITISNPSALVPMVPSILAKIRSCSKEVEKQCGDNATLRKPGIPLLIEVPGRPLLLGIEKYLTVRSGMSFSFWLLNHRLPEANSPCGTGGGSGSGGGSSGGSGFSVPSPARACVAATLANSDAGSGAKFKEAHDKCAASMPNGPRSVSRLEMQGFWPVVVAVGVRAAAIAGRCAASELCREVVVASIMGVVGGYVALESTVGLERDKQAANESGRKTGDAGAKDECPAGEAYCQSWHEGYAAGKANREAREEKEKKQKEEAQKLAEEKRLKEEAEKKQKEEAEKKSEEEKKKKEEEEKKKAEERNKIEEERKKKAQKNGLPDPLAPDKLTAECQAYFDMIGPKQDDYGVTLQQMYTDPNPLDVAGDVNVCTDALVQDYSVSKCQMQIRCPAGRKTKDRDGKCSCSSTAEYNMKTAKRSQCRYVTCTGEETSGCCAVLDSL